MTKIGQRPFDAVLIDFYGTIAAGDRAAVEAACATIVTQCKLSLTAAEFAIRWGERFFQVVEDSSHHAFRTLYECEMTSLRETFGSMEIDADPAPFVAQLEAYWRDPPIHADAVELLSRLPLPVCVVSNADTVPLAAAIEKHNLKFDGVISSESVRSYKPDGQIFWHALCKLGVQPERAIHVGDSLHSDVGGARSAGITAAWIRRDDRIHDIGMTEPCHTCSSLCDLLELFR